MNLQLLVFERLPSQTSSLEAYQLVCQGGGLELRRPPKTRILLINTIHIKHTK